MPRTVLFFHPGGLTDFTIGRRAWRSASEPHKRAFLRARGHAVTRLSAPEAPTRRRMTFWGEWEADAWGHEIPGATRPGLPTFCLEPRLARRESYSGLHNTDPFVFGGPFLYSNCMQRSFRNVLGELARGDTILFGSHVKGGFAVDTVLVVDQRHPYRPRSWREDLPSDLVRPSFEVATLEPLAAAGGDGGDGCAEPPDSTLSLYVGATPADAVPDVGFSFVPALPEGDDPMAFARPVVLPTNMTEGVAGNVKLSWTDVAKAVLDAGLVLGVAFDEPV